MKWILKIELQRSEYASQKFVVSTQITSKIPSCKYIFKKLKTTDRIPAPSSGYCDVTPLFPSKVYLGSSLSATGFLQLQNTETLIQPLFHCKFPVVSEYI